MFLIDMHTHTRYGSQCAYMDPEDLIMRAKALGLDGVCITEHNQLWSPEALEKLRREHQFLVLGGVEVTTDAGEVLAFGLKGRLVEIYAAADLRQAVEEEGGVIVAAHPFRGYLSLADRDLDGPPSLEEASLRPLFRYVDAIEVYNGMTSYRETEFTAQVASHLGLKGTGGSDAHSIMGVGNCATDFENKIENEADLIREIKGGRFCGLDWHWLPPEKRFRNLMHRYHF